MKISHVKTMILVGEVKLNGHEKKLKFIPAISKEQMLDIRGRVYCIVVDGTIEKIGGSQDKGGIKQTIGWYLNGYTRGNSERTYCTWNFLRKALLANKKVEIWCVWAPLVTVEIPTMTGTVIKEIPVDFHIIENLFNHEYFTIEGRNPKLNIQESGKKWHDTGLLEGYINKDGTIYGSGSSSKA